MFRNKKRAEDLRDRLRKYDKRGYHRVLLNDSKLIWTIFSKEYDVGDRITWLGHDNVFGLMYGQEITADQEAVEKSENLSFMKKIDELNFEPYKNL